MTRQDMDGQGKAHPAERSARINGWIDWVSVAANEGASLRR